MEYLTCRAATQLKLGKFPAALEDAERAISLDSKNHMALHWKGIALFYTSDFAASKLAFGSSLAIAPNAKAPRALWIRKCDAELSGSTLPLGGVAAEASKSTVSGAPVAKPTVQQAPPAVDGAAAMPAPSAADTEAVPKSGKAQASTAAPTKDRLFDCQG